MAKLYQHPEALPPREDWIRLAAFIDGEGCIAIGKSRTTIRNGRTHTKHGTPYIAGSGFSVRVSNTDPRMPQWCGRTFGGSVYVYRYPSGPRRPIAIWIVHGKFAEWVLKGCLEHFIVKREQAEIALEYQSLVYGSSQKPVTTDHLARRAELHGRLLMLRKGA